MNRMYVVPALIILSVALASAHRAHVRCTSFATPTGTSEALKREQVSTAGLSSLTSCSRKIL